MPVRNRLSLSSAWLAPLNRGSLNSAHIHGTDVPVEEPSTASRADINVEDLLTPRKQSEFPCTSVIALSALQRARLRKQDLQYNAAEPRKSYQFPGWPC